MLDLSSEVGFACPGTSQYFLHPAIDARDSTLNVCRSMSSTSTITAANSAFIQRQTCSRLVPATQNASKWPSRSDESVNLHPNNSDGLQPKQPETNLGFCFEKTLNLN